MDAIRQGDIPGVQLRLRRRLAVEPAELWLWLTDPDRMRRWLGELEEKTADALVIESDLESEPLREELQILERDRPRTWAVTLRRLGADWEVSTPLTFEIAARPGGCELSIFQRGFEQLKLSTCLTEWERYRRRWRRAVDRLEAALAAV